MPTPSHRRTSVVVGLVLAASALAPAAVSGADPLTVVTNFTDAQIRSEVPTGLVELQIFDRILVSGGSPPYAVTWSRPAMIDGGEYGPQFWSDTETEYGVEGMVACSALPSTLQATVRDAAGGQVTSDPFSLPACPASPPTGSFSLAPNPVNAGDPVTITSGVVNMQNIATCTFFIIGMEEWGTGQAFGGSSSAIINGSPTASGSDCEPATFAPAQAGRYNFQAIVIGQAAPSGVPAYIALNRNVDIGVITPVAFSLLSPTSGTDVRYTIKSGTVAKIRFEATDSGVGLTDTSRFTTSVAQIACPDTPTTGTVNLATHGGRSRALAYDARRGEFAFDWKSPSKSAGTCWYTRFTVDGLTSLSVWVELT
jgi:hypothetical protein